MGIFIKRSLAQKITTISLLTLTLPCLLFSFYLYRQQSRSFYEQLVNEQRLAIEQTTENLNATLYSISELSQDLAYGSPLNEYLAKQNRVDLAKYPTWNEQKLKEVITSIKYSLKYRNLGITAANIYIVDGSMQEGNYFWFSKRLSDLWFFQDFQQQEASSALYYLDGQQTANFRAVRGYSNYSAEEDTILLIRRIETLNPKICLGYLIFECSPSEVFPDPFSPTGKKGSYYAWFQNASSGYGTQPSPALEEALRRLDSPDSYLYEGKQQYAVSFTEQFHITVLDTKPLVTDSYKLPALGLSLFLILLALLQIVLLSFYIRYTFKKLHRDLNLMDSIVAHGFNGRIPELRTDEIGMIAHRYNVLLDKIDVLIQETVKKETAHTQAQLKALQYQINPHFIYNTLSIFSGYAAKKGEDELAESIASFGQLLRYIIKSGDSYSTVEEELKNASSLLRIYNIRYFNQLGLTVEAAPELKKKRIIKFLLQPLLENAILHGLTPPRTALHISVSIQRAGDFLELLICDDGVGMSKDRLCQVRRRMSCPDEEVLEESTGSFIGLCNIRQRLDLFYDHQAQMSIDSAEDSGTSILIRIPIRYTEENQCTIS